MNYLGKSHSVNDSDRSSSMAGGRFGTRGTFFVMDSPYGALAFPAMYLTNITSNQGVWKEKSVGQHGKYVSVCAGSWPSAIPPGTVRYYGLTLENDALAFSSPGRSAIRPGVDGWVHGRDREVWMRWETRWPRIIHGDTPRRGVSPHRRRESQQIAKDRDSSQAAVLPLSHLFYYSY